MMKNKIDSLFCDDLFLRETDINEAKKFYSKKISEHSKDNFIVLNIKDNSLEVLGNIINTINKTNKYSIKITLNEAFKHIHKDDIESIHERIESSILNSSPIYADFRINSTDDSTRWVSLKIKPLFNNKGEVIYYYGYIHDITIEKIADSEMHSSKTNGKDSYQLFDNSISTELNRTFAIQKGLRTALDNNELFVVFQPKVILDSLVVNGFEALIRWNNSELGVVGPTEFIPVAESTKLIIPIGKFVLEEAFKKVKTLLDEGFKDFKIAVNFSEVQFRYGDILSDFNEFKEKYKVSPEYIEMEITESILIKTVEDNITKLDTIKKLGVSIALDDFGTGYSSLNYLTKLPIDVLKIDRSFVIDLVENKKSRCIVENIINLSHQLGIDVVAEGVEDLEQVEYLKDILCDIVQGYYFSKPGEFDSVKTLLGKKL